MKTRALERIEAMKVGALKNILNNPEEHRKFEWRVYGAIDMAMELNLLTNEEFRKLRNEFRKIAKETYRKAIEK